MAYSIKLLEVSSNIDVVQEELIAILETSRFIVNGLTTTRPTKTYKGGIVELREIRLKEPKPYCGNHAGPCLIERPHRKARYLEGLDWVEFNDLVNSVLDRLHIPADVASSACTIRKGLKRRVVYEGGPNGDWDKTGRSQDYEDWCGKDAPSSNYPMGTPGGEPMKVE